MERARFFLAAGSVLRSSDGGASWTGVASGLAGSAQAVGSRGDTVFVGSSRGNVHRSVDGGTSWTTVPTSGVPGSYRSIRMVGGTVVTVGAGVFRSPDGGVSWQLLGASTGYGLYLRDAENGVIVGAGGMILRLAR